MSSSPLFCLFSVAFSFSSPVWPPNGGLFQGSHSALLSSCLVTVAFGTSYQVHGSRIIHVLMTVAQNSPQVPHMDTQLSTRHLHLFNGHLRLIYNTGNTNSCLSFLTQFCNSQSLLLVNVYYMLPNPSASSAWSPHKIPGRSSPCLCLYHPDASHHHPLLCAAAASQLVFSLYSCTLQFIFHITT